MRTVFLSAFILLLMAVAAQDDPPQTRLFVPVQFAGSIGLLSSGLGAAILKEKVEVCALYGYLPRVHGGPVHSATLKFGFAMFRKRLNPAFSITPLTAGLFFAQHFGNNLHTTWDARYPKGYYWWPRNMRQHLFLSTCVAFHPGSELIEKIALYFEMNTNDLYLYSYIPNTRALQWHEIVFFGTGLKVFLH